jgi:hypothetical protein
MEELVNIIGEEIPYENDDFTLENLLNMNIYARSDEIIELALKA